MTISRRDYVSVSLNFTYLLQKVVDLSSDG